MKLSQITSLSNINLKSRHGKQILIIALLVLALILIAAIAFVIHRKRGKTAATELFEQSACIYCIMITGKDDQRLRWARLAVENFKSQDYPNKRLIIINHSKNLNNRVLTNNDGTDGIVEIHVEKSPTMLLGHMRNMALELVPFNALWTPWDDDDIRAPNYLSFLAKHMTSLHHAVAFTDRMEVNLQNKFVWRVSLKPNGTVHILCRASDKRVRYLLRDTMEDVNLHRDILRLGHQINVVQDNDPTLYIRLVHGNNTSLYVDPNRAELKFAFEKRATSEERAYVLHASEPYSSFG